MMSLTGMAKDDIKAKVTLSEDLGIVTTSSRYVQMAVDSRRSETFLTWPSGMSKQPPDFVSKGLFYTGTFSNWDLSSHD